MEYNELTHWGVKGMRWGVRRYQNEDGSLTASGRRRYNQSDDSKAASEIRKKSVREMSNAELRRLNERTRLEKEYKQLNPSGFKKGVAFVTSAAAIMGTAVSIYNNGNSLVRIGRTVGSKVIKSIGNMVT